MTAGRKPAQSTPPSVLPASSESAYYRHYFWDHRGSRINRHGAPMRNPWMWTTVALAMCFVLPAHAQQKIGKATSVKPEARGSVAGQLIPDSDVYVNETVSTGSGGQADLQFVD